METYRLKNIVILILLLLNLFLLLLLASSYSTQFKASQDLIAQTVSLLDKNGISVEASLLQEEKKPLSAYSAERNKEEEAAFAAAFLGALLSTGDAGGGTDVYSGINGTAAFRSNGSFSLSRTAAAEPISYYEGFVAEHCPPHYRAVDLQQEKDTLRLVAIPFVGEHPVFGAPIEFLFTGDNLLSVSGYFLSAPDDTAQTAGSISKCSAVVSLMDYCHAEGRICNQITAISTGYLLQSTVSIPLLLSPVYKIDTNMNSYYVNQSTGHVLPIK